MEYVALLVLWIIFVTVGSIMAFVRGGHRREVDELKREIASLSKRLLAVERAAATREAEEIAPESKAAEEFVPILVNDSEPAQDFADAEISTYLTKEAPLESETHNSPSLSEGVDCEARRGSGAPMAHPTIKPEPSTYTGSKTVDALLGFLRGGNIWVTLGVVFVVLGLAFTYKYVASIYHVPDALKIAAGMLVGVALFAVGWKQRIKRRTFAMVVQGGGIGIFYLSLFASAKIYTVFPIPMAFVLIAVLVALAVLISVLQSSEVLALFSIVIGYAAPLLLSSGSGSYIVLFSYYGIIGLAVLAIAFKKYWRYLNSISFLFTFAVLGYWCTEHAWHSQFIDLELFLVGFFLIFTAINILASLRQAALTKLVGYAIIENAYALTLSFAYMTLQMFTTRPHQYGQAIASLTLGIFYIALSYWLLRCYKRQLKLLVQLYLALGIVFVNFALPFALEGDWTAGIWAVEGAALVVLGVHQSNRLFQYFGTALILLAICFGFNMQQASDAMFFVNNVWLVRFLATTSLIVSACTYNKRISGKLVTAYSMLAYVSLGLGLLLWYAFFYQELQRIYQSHLWLNRLMLILMLVSFSALLFNFVARKVRWSQLRLIAGTPLILALGITLFGGFDDIYYLSILSFLYPSSLWVNLNGLIGWLPFFISSAVFIYQYYIKVKSLPDRVGGMLAAAFVFVLTILISANIAYLVRHFELAIVSTALALWLTTSRYSLRIPLLREYRFIVGLPLLVYLLLSILATSSIGMPYIGPKLPFLNMLDLALLAALAAAIYWLLFWKKAHREEPLWQHRLNIALAATGAVAFIWLHFALARGVAELSQLSYDAGELLYYPTYQLSIAIFWAITGFALMLIGKKLAKRPPWLTGAVLLACDAVKLFLVDLANAGTLPRIGSFMAVGLIFIVIGYFVPLPPKGDKE